MNITLLGYGKMGHAIEEIALQRGHTIVCAVGLENLEDKTSENLRKADVVIEFTGPDSAVENLKMCFDLGVPVVCGSTGWIRDLEEVKNYCDSRNGGFLYSSNFSIGVNIFFALNQYLARLMQAHPSYEVDMKEIHHTAKLDAPSGTAITLAQDIIGMSETKTRWTNHPSAVREDLVIISERTDPAPGTHIVNYRSEIDDISITHTAHSRKGFATGAVLAAEFMAMNKNGRYSMKDVLGIG